MCRMPWVAVDDRPEVASMAVASATPLRLVWQPAPAIKRTSLGVAPADSRDAAGPALAASRGADLRELVLPGAA